MRRGTAKDALARLRWMEPGRDWATVEIVVRHRGAPRDEKTVRGSRVTGLETSFFEVDGETSIPYHRILRVVVDGVAVYERGSPSDKSS